MRIYLIRHGDPDYVHDDLTPLGVQQAEALASFLQHEGLTALYTSPMGRAQRTAASTARLTGLTPIVLPWAHELHCPPIEVPPVGRTVVFTLPGEVLFRDAPTPCYTGWEKPPYLDDPQ
ncbi:MAG: histidine phosphatase family protein, partial [Clostridia bacterium]